MQFLIDNNITDKGEYQLTNALDAMRKNGFKLLPGKVDEWLDCGNKDATVYTNQRVLELNKHSEQLISKSLRNMNSQIIEPCFIGNNVFIENSVIGPHVSIGEGCIIKNAIISNSIIQKSTDIQNKIITNSMIGSHVSIKDSAEDLSIGDFTTSIC